MNKVLFAYSSREGHTYKILQTIQQEILDVADVEYYNLEQDISKKNLSYYDYILVASSIHYGHYSKSFYKFVNANADILNKVDSNFLSVNLTARKPGKDNPKTSGYIAKLKLKTLWRPKNIVMFAGVLNYPKYSFFDKRMIQFIMYLTKGETDTSKTVEYTDWDKVAKFANKLKKKLSK